MQAMETVDRVDVAEAVVHHLKARKETRWAGWQTRSDYPERDDAHFDCFIAVSYTPLDVYKRQHAFRLSGTRNPQFESSAWERFVLLFFYIIISI